MQPEDLFIQDISGKDLAIPKKKLKKSQCTPLFMCAYTGRIMELRDSCLKQKKLDLYDSRFNYKSIFNVFENMNISARGAGAVIHTHSKTALMVTLLFDKEFKCTHLEMIKVHNMPVCYIMELNGLSTFPRMVINLNLILKGNLQPREKVQLPLR